MAPGARTPIPAPENRVPTTGLVALANTRTDEGERAEAWVNGFGFEPEATDDVQVIALGCGSSPEKDVPDNPAFVLYDPAVLVAADACSTLTPDRDREGRARRLLLGATSAGVEELFWTGVAEGDAVTVERPSLTDSTATELAGGTAVSPSRAIALLDQALTACLHGVAGMVHVTPLLLVTLVENDLVWRRDDRWLTPNGHTVVAGAGYTGGAPRDTPDGALPAAPDLLANPAVDQWAYATPLVHVLLGPVVTFPTRAQRIDRSVNTETVLAERAAAAFHGGCKFAVQIDLTP